MERPRLQLFEFNDAPWAPVPLREAIVEALSRTLRWGRVLDRLADPFRAFLDERGADEVLDLCAGAGGPAAILARALARDGRRVPRFLLTDLQPHPEEWARLRDELPDAVDFIAEPVDATAIPAGLGEGRARVIINALHHFPPSLAGEILRGACVRSPGVFVSEAFERRLTGVAPIALAGIPALYATPLLSPRRRLEKALLTWAAPIALLASVWDGLVSTMRVYSEAELRAMVAPVEGYRWTYGRYRFPAGGVGYYFYGIRA